MQCYHRRCFRASRWTQRQRYQYRHVLHVAPFQIKHHPDCKSSTAHDAVVVQSTTRHCSQSYSSVVIDMNAFYYAFVVVFSVIYMAISFLYDTCNS